jgi:Na+-transporting NADH:ubiquinone oxidoreductase subunit C
MAKDSIGKTFGVAAGMCIVASLFVSFAAVQLKPLQEKNKVVEKKKNILLAGGLYSDGADIEAVYDEKITERIVDLESGKYTDAIDAASFDQRSAAKGGEYSVMIPSSKDKARIKRRSKFAKVYEIKDGDTLSQIILPVHGKGLWSTMYGFLALKPDANTVVGMGFYEHGETPGLGGEVDNPRWKGQWPGKQIFSGNKIAFDVVKGSVDKSRPEAIHQVDGLSGATLTSVGVEYLIHYWLGDDAFGPYLANVRNGGVN